MKVAIALLLVCLTTLESHRIDYDLLQSQEVSDTAVSLSKSPLFLERNDFLETEIVINSASNTAFVESNNFRRTQAKVDLVWDDLLYQLCVDHNTYQISKGTISHDGFADRCYKIPNWSSCAENVAYNYDNVNPGKTVVNQWINSSGHRANLLSSNKYMGVSGVNDATTGRWYFCQFFANHA